jgi:hypothetical protein
MKNRKNSPAENFSKNIQIVLENYYKDAVSENVRRILQDKTNTDDFTNVK